MAQYRISQKELVAVAKLYNQGLIYKEIAERTGIAFSRIPGFVGKARRQKLVGRRLASYKKKKKRKSPFVSVSTSSPKTDTLHALARQIVNLEVHKLSKVAQASLQILIG